VGSLRSLRVGSSSTRRIGAVVRLRAATATSAGGIVVRHESGRAWLVVGSRRRERDGRTWTLPKGTPEPGESREETALREVAEETGLEVRITGPLDSIHYQFVQSGQRIHKTVHYFMMEATGGDLANHDHEFEQVRWVTFEDAASSLTFETERILVARAAAMIDEQPPQADGERAPAIAAEVARETPAAEAAP
jgi:8-oxo-dGTP pyrophosphatase MutT (NUDIX family)